MKKLIITITITSILGLTFSACATKRYGRLQNITDLESKSMTCNQIKIEIDKSEIFIKKVEKKDDEFTGKDVLAFLGDFGIGNNMEVSEAIESAKSRLKDLQILEKNKNCIN